MTSWRTDIDPNAEHFAEIKEELREQQKINAAIFRVLEKVVNQQLRPLAYEGIESLRSDLHELEGLLPLEPPQ